MAEIIDRSKYENIVAPDGSLLEAVYRIQEAQSEKSCARGVCPLGRRILPTMTYARIYYPDTNEVEFMHTGCFKMEFPDVTRNRR